MTNKKKLKEFIIDTISNLKYKIFIFFYALMAYGFNVFNRTVSMDDLAISYFGDELKIMLKGTRWSQYFLGLKILFGDYYPTLRGIVSIIALIIASLVICYIFYLINEKININEIILFSSLFLTFPIINELWEYGYDTVSIYFVLVAISVLFQLKNPNKSIKKQIIAGLIILPAMAGYESVIFVYVTLVFIILYLKEINGKQYQKGWFFDGLSYVLPLVIALLLRYIIGFSLIKLYGLEYQNVGNGAIKWFIDGFEECLISVLYNGWYYIIRGLSYFPIGEFVISMIIFLVFTIKERINGKKNILPIAFFLIMSLFFLSFLQGEYLHYRNAQTLQVFVPFVAYLLLTEIRDKKIFNINIKAVITVLLFYVSFRQSVYLHQLLALNNQRSDNEMAVFREIGYKIYSEFDKDKTVIFCGEYQLGDYIEDQITVKEGSIAEKVEDWLREITGKEEGRLYQEFVSTNVNSYYNTQKDAFSGQVMIKYYMSYLGYDINVVDNLTDEEEEYLKHGYEEIAKKENMKPYEIKDMGDYLLVYLGPTIDGINSD